MIPVFYGIDEIVGYAFAWLAIGFALGLLPAALAKAKGQSWRGPLIASSLIGASFVGWIVVIAYVIYQEDHQTAAKFKKIEAGLARLAGLPGSEADGKTALSCPACGVLNAADASFCGGCGKAMPAPPYASPRQNECWRCSSIILPETMFCRQCGAALAERR